MLTTWLKSSLLSLFVVFQAALAVDGGETASSSPPPSTVSLQQCPVKWSWGPWSTCDPASCTRYRRRRCELPVTCSKEVCMDKAFARQRAVVRRYRPCTLHDRLNVCATKPAMNRHWGSSPFVTFNPGSRLSAFRKPSKLWRQLTPIYIDPALINDGVRPTRRRKFNRQERQERFESSPFAAAFSRTGSSSFGSTSSRNDDGGGIEITIRNISLEELSTTTLAPPQAVFGEINGETPGAFSSFTAFFGQWSSWSSCESVAVAANNTPSSCAQIRTRVCSVPPICGDYVLLHRRRCRTSSCLQHQKGNNATNQLTTTSVATTQTATTTPKPPPIFDDAMIQALLPHQFRQFAVIPSTLTPTSASVSKQCGISEYLPYQKQPRIIGGRLVPRGKWPWMVVLVNRRGEQFCGGALVASQWVLTAAHCLDRVAAIRIGDHALDKYDPGEVTLRPAAIFAHPNYNPDDFDSDIGLILLDRPLNYSKYIISACLPPPERERSPSPAGAPEVGGGLRAGTMCTVVGWGKLAEHYPTGSARPREVRVPIVSRQACRKAYADQLTPTQICAGYLAGGRDSCGGDSGGPLMCQEPITVSERSIDANGQSQTTSRITFRWIVEGLVSHGDGCGLQNKYGVYTRVDAFTDWVNAIISRPETFLGK